jgi:hypothetical protein
MFSMYLSWKRKTYAELGGNWSNLNYRCLIVCSCFFLKIIFSVTSAYFIIDPRVVLQDLTPSKEGSRLPFWPHFESTIRNSKKMKPSHCVMLCDLVWKKINKLGLSQILYKILLRNELPCIELHGFKAKWARSWPKSWHSMFNWPHIVHVCLLGWQTMFILGVSFSAHKKFVFYFPNVKNGFFCETTTKYLMLNWTTRVI